MPSQFSLSQNYPNPFNPSTTVRYELPASGHVTLKIFDMLGREVETVVNEQQSAGRYATQFNASSLASGIYVYRLTSGSTAATRKMVILK